MISETPEGVVLELRVQPGAGRAGVVGRHGDALKVRVAAPPVDGRANEAVIELVAEELGIKSARVVLVSGHTARTKRVLVRGISLDAVENWLVRHGVPR